MLSMLTHGPSSHAMLRWCREAALGAEVRLLREELASAQDAAASAAGHAKQYQALATSSDEALRSMQVQYHNQRSPSENHF